MVLSRTCTFASKLTKELINAASMGRASATVIYLPMRGCIQERASRTDGGRNSSSGSHLLLTSDPAAGGSI